LSLESFSRFSDTQVVRELDLRDYLEIEADASDECISIRSS
jgi:hypothetical protein